MTVAPLRSREALKLIEPAWEYRFSMAGGTQVPVSVGRTGDAVVVRPEGACTVAICETVGHFLKTCQKPEISAIYVDLVNVPWMDSTFIGCLIGVAVERGNPTTPTVHLLRPPSHVLDVLTKMHVLHLFEVCDSCPEAPDWEVLPHRPLPYERVAEVVISAHQRLIDVDRRNSPTFQPVVDLFAAQRQRLQQRRGGATS